MAFSRRQLKHDLMSAGEVADYLGVQPGTVRAFLAKGRIVEPLVILGSGPIWLRDDIVRWERERETRLSTRRIPA